MPNVTNTDRSERLDQWRSTIDEALAAIPPTKPIMPLHEAVAFVLAGSGKRIRPLLLLATANAFGANARRAMPAALAVEVFHNFTLVHDDIMDRSDSRRGRPTVHVKWDESTGILTGDFLLAASFDLLTRLDDDVMAEAIARFHQMVVLLCEGQALDTEYEKRTTVTADEYLDMVFRKTGALLEASMSLAGLVAGVSASDRELLEATGRHAGCAFQVQDDLLDLTADADSWGKPLGNDLMSAKKSYLTVRALEMEADSGDTWFTERMAAGGIAAAEVIEARDRLADMGVLEDARQQVTRHYQSALDALKLVGREGDLADTRWIIERLLTRSV